MTIVLIIIYLLLGRILPWSLAVTVALISGRRRSVISGLLISGILGLIEDVVRIRPLGLTSLLLMTLTAGVWLMETQYRPRFAWWWIGAAIAGEVLIHWVQARPGASLLVLVAQVSTLFFVLWLMRRTKESEGIYVES